MRQRPQYNDNRNTRRGENLDLGFKKSCKHLEEIEEVDYKDHELLKKFMSERGKIIPRRGTYANSKQQRQIKRAIRRARVMGLVS